MKIIEPNLMAQDFANKNITFIIFDRNGDDYRQKVYASMESYSTSYIMVGT